MNWMINLHLFFSFFTTQLILCQMAKFFTIFTILSPFNVKIQFGCSSLWLHHEIEKISVP
jgi:hypothetical protein